MKGGTRADGVRGSGGGLALVLVLTTALTGCHHRQPQTVLLPAKTPVPLEPLPSEAETPVIEPTKPKLPPVPVATTAVPQKKKKRPHGTQTPPAGTAQAPASAAKGGEVETASAAAPTATATAVEIGSLTVGGDQSPKLRQDAQDLLQANEKRLNGLSTDVQQKQAALVSKARAFQRDAQQALRSGDAEGAKTLATKGKLLLDDLEQGNAPK